MADLWLQENESYLIEIRRYLHRHPEVGFKEFETSRYLREILTKAGYSINHRKEMITGFTCEYGEGKGPVLAIRCDLDALAMNDAKEVPYKSANRGVMHACGHDVHMAVATGLALWLQKTRPQLPGRVRFIYQPAEEQAPGGAECMIENGAIDGVDHIIGYHMLPRLKAGKIGIRYGAMSAAVELLDITLRGEGGHTSRPHETADLISAMSQLVMGLGETILHSLDQRSPVVLSFGMVKGGDTFNVIPHQVNLQGTLRFQDPAIQDKLHQVIREKVNIISADTGAEITCEIPYYAPGIINDRWITDLIIRSGIESLGEENVELLEQASMGGEDFANYLEHIPGAYFRVGSNDGKARDVHTVNFDVNEKAIPTAVKTLQKIILHYFRR